MRRDGFCGWGILLRSVTTLRALLGAVLLLLLAEEAAAAQAGEISLPWVGQKSATECGRAVLASLAARRGGDAEAFYRRLPPPPDAEHGYSIAEMQHFGAEVGVHLTLKVPQGVVIAGECLPAPSATAYFKKLAGLVRASQPVVVPVDSRPGSGHYLVLVGADRGDFTVLDPASPGLRRIPDLQLAALMCSFGYIALVSR